MTTGKALLVAVDNTIIDLFEKVDDQLIAKLGIIKGQMNLLSEEQIDALLKELPAAKVSPGGAAANVLNILARLGDDVAFFGNVGQDAHGKLFEEDLRKNGVRSLLTSSPGHTGRVISFVTPDAQRTFGLHLGVSCKLRPELVPVEAIGQAKLLYLSGFVLVQATAAVQRALEAAAASSTKVVIDIADPGLVATNRELFRRTLERCDIAFANDEEATAFADVDGNVSEALGRLVPLAVVKHGAKGSTIVKGESRIEIPALEVNAVDTTGAGDAYAAGFLHCFLHNCRLETCGALGALLGAQVVGQLGARLEQLPMREIAQFLNEGREKI